MKKILIFINSLSCGGAEQTAVWLSGHLAALGYKATIVTLYERKTDFLELDDRVGRYSLEMQRENLQGVFENIKACQSLRKILKKENPDVVLGMQTGGGILCLLATLGLSCRVFVSERNYPGRKKVSPLLGLLRKVLYRFANAVIAQTDVTKEWLQQHAGINHVVVIPNAVRPVVDVKPEIHPDDFIGASDNLMLAAGRLSEQKGFDLLIEAFAGSAPSCLGWKLVILGENGRGGRHAQQRDLLEKLVSDKGLSDRVLLPGRAGNMAEWYGRADIFVLSSRYEGFPNVLLEAMASGCPCVAFDCDTGPREIIEHEKNGLLVPPESLSALAQTFERIMHDEGLRHRLSKEAKNVVDLFSEQKIIKKWEEVLYSR
jgi:glycosyltransferase involved in cell wall biosynthesis